MGRREQRKTETNEEMRERLNQLTEQRKGSKTRNKKARTEKTDQTRTVTDTDAEDKSYGHYVCTQSCH
jgi:hypothetical protein